MIRFSAHESIAVEESRGTIWISGKVTQDVRVTMFVSAQEAFTLGRQLIKVSGLAEPNVEQTIVNAQAAGELPS